MPAVKALALLIAICVAMAIAGCGGGDDSSADSTAAAESTVAEAPPPAEAPPAEAAAEEEKLQGPKPEVEVPEPLPKKLVIKDLKVGTGREAKKGDEVTVQFVGVRADGSPFQSSWENEEEPFTFDLGSKQVIPGWEKGVPGMKVGGRRELIVPPNLIYHPGIPHPPLSEEDTLVYIVDVLAID
jgi:peptidylprolyl isomerase